MGAKQIEFKRGVKGCKKFINRRAASASMILYVRRVR